MPRKRIRDAGSQPDALGVLGEDRQDGIDLAIETLVGDPQRVVAAGFGELRLPHHLSHRCLSQHQKFKRHVWQSPQAACCWPRADMKTGPTKSVIERQAVECTTGPPSRALATPRCLARPPPVI